MTQRTGPAGVNLADLVLCGGASPRMGSDQALLEYERRLVDRAVRRLGGVAQPVFLACGGHTLLVRGRERPWTARRCRGKAVLPSMHVAGHGDGRQAWFDLELLAAEAAL